jgi:hypothetical protein
VTVRRSPFQTRGLDVFRRAARITAAVFFVAIVALALGLGVVRTFVVDANVSGLDIRFQGQTNYWDLGVATVCAPLETPDFHGKRGDGSCDLRRYSEAHGELAVEWKDGATAQIEVEGNKGLVLTVSDQGNLRDGTRIMVPGSSWTSIGVLSFVGEATLGQPAGSGETKLVLSGSYQVREKPVWSTRTETIKSGDLRKGESIALVQRLNGEVHMAPVYGYITPGLAHANMLDVGIVSQSGQVAMQVRYFGGKTAAEIAPNWIDRTLSSPLVLALAFILSMGIGAAQFAMWTEPGGRIPVSGRAGRSTRRHFNRMRKPDHVPAKRHY